MSARETDRVPDIMRSFWDKAADEDPGFYTATAHHSLDANYFQGGQSEARYYVETFNLPNNLAHNDNKGQWTDAPRSLLEIGCGAGRMTKSFSAMYDSVSAVDISDVMLQQAKTVLAGCRNVQLSKVPGDGSLPFGDDAFDVVFSYIVLQHIPARSIQERYISEAIRVLKPGGMAALQLRRRNPYALGRNLSARLGLHGTGTKGCQPGMERRLSFQAPDPATQLGEHIDDDP